MEIRVGQGIDVHPFASGRKLILGGVEIEHSHGLQGHSDADALLHSLIDAILGAAGKSDIGTLFPDSDMKWKDASSLEMLRLTFRAVNQLGWKIVNIDSTLLIEAPRIAPHVAQIKKNIASALEIAEDCCAIKATTTEKLGFIGRKEGVLACSVVLISR